MPLLQGLKVIDASQFNAGPIVSLYLAGYGAEVIKVERPGGEDSRAIGPFKNGESSYFMSLNRGKRSIALDLKNPDGVEVFRKLCRGADVLVENLLPRRHGPPGRGLGGPEGGKPQARIRCGIRLRPDRRTRATPGLRQPLASRGRPHQRDGGLWAERPCA